MASVILTDNDIVLKLAAFNLLDETCNMLSVSPTDVRVLYTAQYVFQYQKNFSKLSEKYTEAGVRRATEFVKNATPIYDTPDMDERMILSSNERIQPGEALLIAATKGIDYPLLLTGDKRCVVALANGQDTHHIHQRLCNCVCCLEQIIKGLIAQNGYNIVRDRVLPAAKCDSAVLCSFGSTGDYDEAEVIANLDTYIADLERSTGVGWLHRLY